MFWICTAVFVLVSPSHWRSPSCEARGSARPRRRRDSSPARNVAVAGGLSIVALIALLFESVVTGRALDTLTCPTRCAFRSPATSGGGTSQYHNADPSLRRHHRERDPHSRRPPGRDSICCRPTSFTASGSRTCRARSTWCPGAPNELWLQADKPGIVSRAVRRVLRRCSTPTWRSSGRRARPTSSAGSPATRARRRSR